MEETVKVHCNGCLGERNHKLVHAEEVRSPEAEDSGTRYDCYEMLRCCGCDSFCFCHSSYFSDSPDGDKEIRLFHLTYPPAVLRQWPEWFYPFYMSLPGNLVTASDAVEEKLKQEKRNIALLLREIYLALQNDAPSLAAMGIRSLIEYVIVQRIGDEGGFKRNLMAFQKHEYVSSRQRETLETVVELGHASVHRGFSPTAEELTKAMNIVETVIETIYWHPELEAQLKTRIPPRR